MLAQIVRERVPELTHLEQADRWHARFRGLMSGRRLMETLCALAAAED